MAQIVRIQEVQFTIASSASSGSAVVSGFSDPAKMVVIGTWRVADGQSPVLASMTEVDLFSSDITHLNAERWGTPSYAVTITAYVIQFGDDTTVYKGTWSMDNATAIDSAISIGGTVTLAETFGWHYRKSEGEASPSNDSDPDGRLTSFLFSSTTQLEVEREAAKGACEGHWFVVSSETLTVEHVSSSATSGTEHNMTIDTVTLAETALFASCRTSETEDQDDGVWSLDIETTTNLRARRSTSAAGDHYFEAMIVSDPAWTVQRGIFTTATTTDNDTITAVDLTVAVAKSSTSGGGHVESSSNTDGNMDGRFWELWLDSTTQINGQTGDGLSSVLSPWEVIEFQEEPQDFIIEVPGAESSGVVKIQEVTVTIASAASSGTATLSGFTDLSRMVVIGTWRVADGQSPVLARMTEVDLFPTSLTELTAERWGTDSYAVTITAYVIEWSPATTVYKGTWSMDNATAIDSAISIGGTVTLANTFGWHYRKSEGEAAPSIDSDPDGRITSFRFSSTTQLEVEREAAKGACEGHWFVVSHPDLTVEHVASFSAVTMPFGKTITSSDMKRTSVFASYRTDTVSSNGLGCVAFDLTSPTNVRLRRSSSVDTIYAEVMIVSFPTWYVQRGEFTTSGTADNATLEAVVLDQSIVKSTTSRSGDVLSTDVANGRLDGRQWEFWISSTTQINGQTGDGLTALVATWEVVDFGHHPVPAAVLTPASPEDLVELDGLELAVSGTFGALGSSTPLAAIGDLSIVPRPAWIELHAWCPKLPPRDVTNDGLNRYTDDFRKQPKIRALTTEVLDPLQQADSAVREVTGFYGLDSSVGVWLDLYGRILDVERGTMSDGQFRRIIRIRILALRASGNSGDVLEVADLVVRELSLTDPALVAGYLEPGPFEVEITLSGIPQDRWDAVRALVAGTVPVGRRSEFVMTDGVAYFGFSEDTHADRAGFGTGKFSGSIIR